MDLRTLWQPMEGTLPWAPGWLSSAAIMLVAAAGALLAHWLSLRVVLRVPVPGRARGFVQTFVATTTGPSRLALVVLALWAALPSTSFPTAVSRSIGQVLLVALIMLVGWSAMRALEVAATLYLRRFRMDVDDNLHARKHVTQVRALKRIGDVLIALVTTAAALITFTSVRDYGVSLFASAGAASLVVGLAGRPLLTNLIAGVQIAVTQPIRLEDAVIVEGEWGWVEEITSTYVVVRLWDWRRMILPLSYFLEKPFQNWTRETTSLIGSVFLYVDYSVPVEAVRRELTEIARASPLWDGKVVGLQVSDAKEWTVELRAVVSARNAPQTWDLRCELREKLETPANVNRVSKIREKIARITDTQAKRWQTLADVPEDQFEATFAQPSNPSTNGPPVSAGAFLLICRDQSCSRPVLSAAPVGPRMWPLIQRPQAPKELSRSFEIPLVTCLMKRNTNFV